VTISSAYLNIAGILKRYALMHLISSRQQTECYVIYLDINSNHILGPSNMATTPPIRFATISSLRN